MIRRTTTILAIGLSATSASLAQVSVRGITVTDVTPRSIQVVWLASQAATPSLRITRGANCSVEALEAELSSSPRAGTDPAIGQAAAQRGVMVVRAAGLIPDTEYCLQTRTTRSAGGAPTVAPTVPLRVRTQRETVRLSGAGSGQVFNNDLLALELPRADPQAETRGQIGLVSIRGASFPLAAFVGDGIDDDEDPQTPTGRFLVNLDNVYGPTGESLDLIGSEVLSVRLFGLPGGVVEVQASVVPHDHGQGRVVPPDPCSPMGTMFCSGRLGDVDGSGAVTAADADLVRDRYVGLIGQLPCEPCGDAVWDHALGMDDALAIGQAAAGRRQLPW